MKDDEMNKKIGEWLALRREEKGFSQQYVANMLGCTRTAVHYWESGKRTIYATNLLQYCELLGADILDLREYLRS